MNLKELQKNWNELGKIDPLWSILTYHDKKLNKWDINEFFKTGKEDIDIVMRHIKFLGITLPQRKAFDFGCGVGRLTQALAYYFDEVYGVDIALSMIELANKYNRFGSKCKYFLNETEDLKLFPDSSFNFVYSKIVLNHIEPRYSKNYIKEFLRVLSPHGMLVFELADKPKTKIAKFAILMQDIASQNLFVPGFPKMECYGIRRKEVVRFLKKNKAKILDITPDRSAGEHWSSFKYWITKE